VEFLVNAVHFLFPAFDYSWLVEEIKDSLPKACSHDDMPPHRLCPSQASIAAEFTLMLEFCIEVIAANDSMQGLSQGLCCCACRSWTSAWRRQMLSAAGKISARGSRACVAGWR